MIVCHRYGNLYFGSEIHINIEIRTIKLTCITKRNLDHKHPSLEEPFFSFESNTTRTQKANRLTLIKPPDNEECIFK